jgi:hypothetical protein
VFKYLKTTLGLLAEVAMGVHISITDDVLHFRAPHYYLPIHRFGTDRCCNTLLWISLVPVYNETYMSPASFFLFCVVFELSEFICF